MKPNELRIGNIVNCDNEKLIINSITKEGVNICGVEDVILEFSRFDELEPIPLTEEWLLKFGFEKITGIDIEGYRIKTRNSPCEFMLFYYDFLWRFGFDQMQSHCFTHFKYIHNLQNLYFSLTGEELTLK